MKRLRRGDFEHEPLRSSRTGEEFSSSAVLSKALGSAELFIHHEILASGKRASSPHRHSDGEEFVYVLKGRPVVVEGAEAGELSPGDCVLFEAGSAALHYLENRTTEEVEMLVVRKKLAAPDVSYA
jgi:uncharacterized cupin superfamily protein